MKLFRSCRLFRMLAVLLSAVTLVIAAATVVFAAWATHSGFFECSLTESKMELMSNLLYGYADRIVDEYRECYVYGNKSPELTHENMEAVKYRKNFDFSLRCNDEIVYESFDNMPDTGYVLSIGVVDTAEGEYSVCFYIHEDKNYGDEFYYCERWLPILYELQYRIIAVGGAALLLSFLFWLFAVRSAGVRRRREECVPTLFDKIPFDIVLAFVFAIMLVEIMIFDGFWYMDEVLVAALAAACVFVDSIVVTLLSMTVKVRVRTKTLVKNNVVYMILDVTVRVVKRLLALTVGVIRAIPTFWRTLVIMLGVLAADFILMLIVASSGEGEALLLYFIFWAVLVAAACFVAWNMSRLKTGARRISEGDLDYKIDKKHLLFDFREHAENLNSIGDGMAVAVEERIRGERFKTELITNVSHDIKTPITSIINYVDLLKKCDVENEDAKGYIEVLDRQSARLKKLTEDLVTASKASSGAVAVDAKPCALDILVAQTAGEYEEKLAAAGLRLVVKVPDHTVTVMADGKLMWRVFDNLMSNAMKYSLPGTRVYMTLAEEGSVAKVAISNISRDPISRSAEELTERFVRGDESRHTDGSGLGLSIAKSFVMLQGGELSIATDSDLFKVTVIMKIESIEETETETETEEPIAEAPETEPQAAPEAEPEAEPESVSEAEAETETHAPAPEAETETVSETAADEETEDDV